METSNLSEKMAGRKIERLKLYDVLATTEAGLSGEFCKLLRIIIVDCGQSRLVYSSLRACVFASHENKSEQKAQ
jgi:hypothetical protein